MLPADPVTTPLLRQRGELQRPLLHLPLLPATGCLLRALVLQERGACSLSETVSMDVPEVLEALGVPVIHPGAQD